MDSLPESIRKNFSDLARSLASTLNKLAKALHVPATQLIEDVPEAQTETTKNEKSLSEDNG